MGRMIDLYSQVDVNSIIDWTTKKDLWPSIEPCSTPEVTLVFPHSIRMDEILFFEYAASDFLELAWEPGGQPSP